MSRRIPLSEPVMAGNEWRYVKECIDTAWVSSAGKFIDAFAENFAEYVDIPYAVPVVRAITAERARTVRKGRVNDMVSPRGVGVRRAFKKTSGSVMTNLL